MIILGKCKGKVVDKATGYDMSGDYFGLPWPCYGTAEIKHPGSPNLYDTSKHVMEGGGNFRANFGVEREGVSLLAEDGSYSVGSEITTGYPEFDHVLLKKLGWWDDLSEAEKAKLQQEMFVEINPAVAAARGIRNGERAWVTTPTGARINVQALVTERVDKNTVFLPFHFSGHWQGQDLRAHYPAGAAPVVRGEAVNTATTYGYDIVTMMQETKTTVCNVERA
jgi:hypothetical protein